MKALDNEFDNFGEGSSSSGGLATDHPHSKEHHSSTDVQHTQSNHNDMAANPQEVSIEPTATTTGERRRRVPLTEEELRDRSIKYSARRNLKRVLAMATVTPAELEWSMKEKTRRQEERRIAKLREARALTAERLAAKENAKREQQRHQQQRQNPTEGDDQYQGREPEVEDIQAERPKQKHPKRATSEPTEKQLARRAQLSKANKRYRARVRERKRLADEGKPPPTPWKVLVAEQRFKQEEALLKKIQKEREKRERQKEKRKLYYATYKNKRVAMRQEEKPLAEGDKVQPVLTEEEQAKQDRKRKAAQEASVRSRERQLAKQLLQQLAETLQGDPAAAQPPRYLVDKYMGINTPIKAVENVKKQVLAIRTKNGVSPDEPIRVEDLEAILPSWGQKKGVRYGRTKAKIQEDARMQREEEDTTPVVVPTALQPQPPFRREPNLESRLFKKPRPKDLDPDVPDIQATTAAHLAYSLMTREQRLALTLSVLDPEKEFEAYRWPVRESVLPSYVCIDLKETRGFEYAVSPVPLT